MAGKIVLTRSGERLSEVMSFTLARPDWKRFHTVEISPKRHAVMTSELSGTIFLTVRPEPAIGKGKENIEARDSFRSIQKARRQNSACSVSDIP
jgi:hypothetical protein